ncbi:hypothetical protein HMPREF0908_0822 [Selenomonas flueggei ATCC 43531]|uniref:Uncharacterized protein n=1 Tax=Selenomonas flueggei ATCC 43531 TaxID=638302 RepID=C4V2V8_9FIRM|nr:hypothetical protein HMPREF0908_0822 [Selenomonas flueggei ATCC 43531]
MGRDIPVFNDNPALCVSIHAPRVGRDLRRRSANPLFVLFQSTRPVWGATISFADYLDIWYVSIHAPRVGRDCPLLTPPCT